MVDPDVPEPSSERLGVALSLASAATSALYLIPFRRATELAPAEHATIGLLVCAASFSTLAAPLEALRIRGREAPSAASISIGAYVRVGALLAVFSALGNHAAGETIARLSPAVASVLMQIQVLFVALAGYLWLGERVSARFVLGALLSCAGVYAMRAGDGVATDALVGTAWGLASAFSFGMMQLIARKYAASLNVVVLNALRLWLSCGVLLLASGAWAGLRALPASAWLFVAFAAAAGPFFGRICLLHAARHVSAALATLLGLSAPLFALALGVLALSVWPSTQELVGGAVVLVGMLVAIARW